MTKSLFNFIKENKEKMFFVLFLYSLSLFSIGIVNYPYIDDISRRLNGQAKFGEHYARYFSEFSAYLVQGSRHLTDQGVATFLLSAFLLTVTSCLVLYCFSKNNKVSWISACASIIIGLNPWFLEAISFRFDGPYLVLSVLVSVIPFLFFDSKNSIYFVISIISIFLMFNSYQGSSGIYIIILLSLVLLRLLEGADFRLLIKKIITSFFSYLIAVVMYLIEMSLNPQLAMRGDNTKMAALHDMPKAIYNNLHVYFDKLYTQSARIWFYLFFLAIVAFVIYMVVNSKINRCIAFPVTLLYLILCSSLSYGIYMFLSNPIALQRPRYMYGFGFFVSIVLIILGSRTKFRPFDFCKGIVTMFLVYYLYTFTFTYSSVLYMQKETFVSQSMLLAEDLNDYITDNDQTIYVNSFLKDSHVFHNTALNYPILIDLVPSNSSLYWPNLLWFNSITDLNVNFVEYNFDNSNKDKFEIIEENKLWDIYRLDDEIYVYRDLQEIDYFHGSVKYF